MSFPERVDVLIAGAGPAGLTAANFLLPAGASVLLVDVRKSIGSPVRCGELTRLKLWETLEMEPRDRWVRNSLPKQGGAVVIDRRNLEYDWSRQLAQQGIIVREATGVIGVGDYDGNGRRVTLRSGGKTQEVFARCLIAADGVSSRVAQYCGVNTFLSPAEMGSCLAYRLADARLPTRDYYFINYLPGRHPYYFWVIPGRPREANVGVVLPAAQGFMLKKILDRLIRESALVMGGGIVETIAGIYPIASPLEKPFADGLMVTGTAARLIDPSTGEGILFAAISGKKAAQTFAGVSATTAAELAQYRTAINDVYETLGKMWETEAGAEERADG